MGKLKAWLNVIRVKFFIAGIPPTFLGASLAWYLSGSFNPFHFLLTLIGIILAMIGTYTFNEYFDFRSGVDIIIKEYDITPFNAGSRVLPSGYLDPSSVLRAGIIAWVLYFAIGTYFVVVTGLPVLALVIVGFLTGAFYTMPPIKWAYRGLGEFMIGLTYGPMIVFGSYYVQAMDLELLKVFFPSLVAGLLITAVIWINEFPDYHADLQAGKMNLVARLGRAKAKKIYHAIVIGSYAVPVLGTLIGVMPIASLAVFVTAPIAYRCIKVADAYYNDSQRLIPSMQGTILLFTVSTFVLTISYVLSRVIAL